MNTEPMGNNINEFSDSQAGLNSRMNSSRMMKLDHLFAELNADVRHDLMKYLEDLGPVNETSMLVIPSSQHFFYDTEDMKGVKTVVNLKQLNYVREIRDFLHNVSKMLPNGSHFVGCFIDNRTQNGFSDKYGNLPGNLSEKAEAYENGIESSIPFINRMYSFIDLRTNRYLTKRTVSNLLEECRLQLIGMTEINGLTYFHAKKSSARIGLIA